MGARTFLVANGLMLLCVSAHAEVPVFVNRAATAGLAGVTGNVGSYASGIVFADLDGDHWPDLYVGRGRLEHNTLCINRHDGTFACAPEGPVNDGGVMGIAAGDYDGNGTLDLYICRYGVANVLLSNDGAAHFTDVTKKAGVGGLTGLFSEVASFFDYDRDGHLDLHVTRWYLSEVSPEFSIDQMFHNRGDGTFEAVSVGLDNQGRSGLMELAFDYDGDGWIDLYRGGDFAQAILFRNQGNGKFADTSATQSATFQDAVREAMGGDVADFNGDGLLDFYVSDSMAADASVGNGLFLNRGGGLYDVAGLTDSVAADFSWGVGAYDLNNDTWPDLFVASLWTGYHFVFENHAGNSFTETHLPSAASGTRDCVTTAFADYDEDGKIDLIAYAAQGRAIELWHNETPSAADGAHWLSVRAQGAPPLVDPIGAIIKVTAGGRTQPRPLLSQASHGAVNDRSLHFGLGAATVADVEIDWPGGAVEHVAGVPADQLIRIVQGQGLQPLDPPPPPDLGVDQGPMVKPPTGDCAMTPGRNARGGTAPAVILLAFFACCARRWARRGSTLTRR